jgi:hypothetical protein
MGHVHSSIRRIEDATSVGSRVTPPYLNHSLHGADFAQRDLVVSRHFEFAHPDTTVLWRRNP